LHHRILRADSDGSRLHAAGRRTGRAGGVGLKVRRSKLAQIDRRDPRLQAARATGTDHGAARPYRHRSPAVRVRSRVSRTSCRTPRAYVCGRAAPCCGLRTGWEAIMASNNFLLKFTGPELANGDATPADRIPTMQPGPVQRTASTRMPTKWGEFQMVGFERTIG